MKNKLFNEAGVSLLEVVFGIAIAALCFLSFTTVTGKMETGRIQNISRTKAMAASATIMQNIRSLAWDEWAVDSSPGSKGRGVYVSTSPVNNASPLGREADDPEGTYDDVDDYDSQNIITGPFTSNVQVYYVNVPLNGSLMTIAADGGKGTQSDDRTDYKLVIVSTTWQGNNLTIKTITANGR